MQQHTGGEDKGNLQKIGEGLGGLMGQAADSAANMFGSMMSQMGGWWAQSANRPQQGGGFSASFGTERDSQCRRHFEAHAQGGGSTRRYDEVRPLYQLGHMAGENPDYRGRSFDQVEMDLERNWGEEQQRRYGSWPDVRGYVQFGYSGEPEAASGRQGGASGGFQASGGGTTGGGASGGFQASAEGSTDRGTSGGFHASGGGSTGGDGASGGLHAEGRIDGREL